MDRYEFIRKIIALYPYASSDSTVLFEKYKRALTDSRIDYEKLFDIYSNEYAEKPAPSGAWLKAQSKRCLKGTESGSWQFVKVYDPRYKAIVNTDCFPKGTSAEIMLKTYEKRFNCSGWQIVEVY